jgi:hypothetical protein
LSQGFIHDEYLSIIMNKYSPSYRPCSACQVKTPPIPFSVTFASIIRHRESTSQEPKRKVSPQAVDERTFVAELIAEFLGTFVLILFGCGVVAMVVLFPANTPAATVHGGYTSITPGWGLAVTM